MIVLKSSMPLVGWICIASVLALPLILLGGNTTAELLRLAEERIKKEDFAPAESLLAQAVAEEPTNAQVLYRLGYVIGSASSLTRDEALPQS